MLKWLRQCVGGPPTLLGKDVTNTLNLADPQTIASFKDVAVDLRAHKPVCPLASGGFLLLDSSDVKAAFSSKQLSNQPSRFSALAPKNIEKYVAASVAANIPPFLDAPKHVAVRQWLMRSFFDRLREFETQIDNIAIAHAGRIEVGHSYLLVEDLARGFVVDAIGQFVGTNVSTTDMKKFTGSLFRLFAPTSDPETFAATNEGLENARAQLIQALQQRRIDQSPCLLNLLDQSDLSGMVGTKKDVMIADNALLILADGVENVEAAIANVMMRAQGDITTAFVRDTISFDTPGQTIPRIAAQDLQIGGEKVHAGTPVFLSLASANDGADPKEDFSFGMGRHKCIGEQLALAMITAFCNQLTARSPKVDVSELQYAAMFGHKWPRGVRLTLTC